MNSMDILKLSAKRKGYGVGRIKPNFQPAVNLPSTQRYSKTANKQKLANKKVSRSYQNLYRHDIWKVDCKMNYTKVQQEFIKFSPSTNKANIYVIF